MSVPCGLCDLYGEHGSPPCHPCGHMPNGMVLPGCYGTIVWARDGHDMDSCHCKRPKRRDVIVSRIETLEAQVAGILNRSPALRAVGVELEEEK